MSTKLYVGGLPYSTTDAELKESFSQAGTVVSASVIVDKMTNRSRGFGFVEMSTPEEGQAAISMWNGQDCAGRRLTVNEARPMGDKPRRSFDHGSDRGPRRSSW